jgi:hypothetical protein
MSTQKPIVATVTVHTHENRRSHFACPNCDRRIVFHNAYPLTFRWKVCPGCRWMWIPVPTGGIGPHADNIVGQTHGLTIGSIGESVDKWRTEL